MSWVSKLFEPKNETATQGGRAAYSPGQNVNGWVLLSNGNWAWTGDPNVHGRTETQPGLFDPATGQGYDQTRAVMGDAQKNELAIRKQQQKVAEQNQATGIAQQNTARTLELLRRQLSQGRMAGTANLRANLAQRGLLDSGSLGAGLGRLNDEYGQQMAAGTMAAANREGDTLLRLMEAEHARQEQEKDRQLRKYLAEQGYQAQIEAARIGASRQPSEPDPWASALGSFAGVLAPQFLPFLAGAGASDSGDSQYRSRSYTTRA